MSERTNDFFRVTLLNAVIVSWTNARVMSDYLGGRTWYSEGKIIFNGSEVVKLYHNGYVKEFRKKGYKYRNITNRPSSIERFLNNVARPIDGAHHVDFYDPKAPRPAKPLFTVSL